MSPYGDVYPCVQFPLPSGNVRDAPFIDIWRRSPQLAEVRSIVMSDVHGVRHVCMAAAAPAARALPTWRATCAGRRTQDCEKSFARTGVMPLPLYGKGAEGSPPDRVS